MFKNWSHVEVCKVDLTQEENYSPLLMGAQKLLCPKSGSVLYKPKCQGWWGDRKCDKMAEASLYQREEQEFAEELFLSIHIFLSMHIMLGSHFRDKKFKIRAIIWFTQSQIASEGWWVRTPRQPQQDPTQHGLQLTLNSPILAICPICLFLFSFSFFSFSEGQSTFFQRDGGERAGRFLHV